jgi:hypothetical protein
MDDRRQVMAKLTLPLARWAKKNKYLSLVWTKLVVHKLYAVSNIFKQDKSVLGPYMPPGVNRIGEVM